MSCTHHWILESPSPGVAMSRGVCKRCGAEGAWPSFEPIDTWRDGADRSYRASGRKPRGKKPPVLTGPSPRTWVG